MKNHLFLSLLATMALAATGCTHDINRQSNDHYGVKPDAVVVTPPTGYPSAMSTNDADRVRVGFAPDRNYFDLPTYNAQALAPNPTLRDDDFVYRSSAPVVKKRAKARPFLHSGITETEALNRLHHVNQTEIALAKLAESKAQSDLILNAAHDRRAKFEQREAKLEALARDRNIRLEAFSPATYEVAVNRELEAKSGQDFEKAYKVALSRYQYEAAAHMRVARQSTKDSKVIALLHEEPLSTSGARASDTSTSGIGQ